MEMPVVTTRLGCEGLQVIDGTNAIIAESADAFAEGIIQLIKNPEKAKEIGKNARSTVFKRYQWAAIMEPLQKQLSLLMLRSDLNQKAVALRRQAA